MSNTQYVKNLYEGFLRCGPDAAGLALSNTRYVTNLYEGFLQRGPDAAGLDLSNTRYVTNLYEGFLRCGPDAAGLGWWAPQATVGQGRQNVLNAFAASSAFRELAGTLYREAYWLVADHLGTPRMVVSKSGTLASVKRHDYLPFGEELFAEVGGRTTAQGYTASDGVRQKFTSKERDIETGLDYFNARYYASTQGRFTSPDPLLSSGSVEDPQSWNRYSYVLNNPTRLVDPDGLYVFDKSVDPDQRKQFNAALAQARANLQQIAKTYGTNSDEYKKAERALAVYGAEGVKNGVTIFAKAGLGHDQTQVEGVAGRKTADNPTGQNIHVTFDTKSFDCSDCLAAGIGHEGVHAANGSDWVKSGFAASSNRRLYDAEMEAFTVQSVIIQFRPDGSATVSLPHFKEPGKNPYLPEKVRIWDSGWAEADRSTLRSANINKILSRPEKAGGYGLTPASTKREHLRGSRFPR